MKVYLACLITLVCFTTSFAAPCPKDEYQKRLSSIGFKDTSSVTQAAEGLIKTAKDQPDKCREDLIFIFRKYYISCLNEYNDRVGPYGINEANENKMNKALSKVGWCVKSTEGSYYIGESAGWLETEIQKVLTHPYKEYLNFRSQEIHEGFSEDAGLLISWDQLRHRIIIWESFLNKYPGFVEKQNIQEYLDIYIRVFLSGMDNSRIHDFDNMTLNKDVKVAYEKFITKNQTSKYYALVKGYYEMIKRNNFVVPKNFYGYLKTKGYKPYLGIQPPTY